MLNLSMFRRIMLVCGAWLSKGLCRETRGGSKNLMEKCRHWEAYWICAPKARQVNADNSALKIRYSFLRIVVPGCHEPKIRLL